MYVQQFQTDPDIKVAILSILAAGVGLTLTAAKLVVFAEMYWTPGVMVQCEDRAHRIGQTSCLPVHYLVAKETMDEWVWSAICKKTLVTSRALNGKKQQLEADAGNCYQIELLSNADVNYAKEDDNSDMDVANYFHSQTPNDQKSILDFFTPPGKVKSNSKNTNEIQHKRKRNNTEDFTISNSKKPKIINQDIVVLDSDSDDEVFHNPQQLKTRTKLFDILYRNSEQSIPSASSGTTLNTSRSERLKQISCHSPVNQIIPEKNKHEIIHSDDTFKQKYQKLNHWSCLSCTFLNHRELPICEMCDSPQPTVCTVQADNEGHSKPEGICSTSEEYENDNCDFVDQSDKEINLSDKEINLNDKEINLSHREINLNDKEINLSDTEINLSDEEDYLNEHTVMNNCALANNEISMSKLIDYKDVEFEANYTIQPDSPDLPSINVPKRLESVNLVSINNKLYNSCTDFTKEKLKMSIENEYEDNKTISSCNKAEITPKPESKKYKFKAKTPVTPSTCKSQECNRKRSHISPINTRTSLFKTQKTGCKDKENNDNGSVTTSTPESCFSLKTVILTKKVGEMKQTPTTKICDTTLVPSSGWISVPDVKYKLFVYCCSKYTGRVYIFNEKEESLNTNFLPLDIEVDNIEVLPELLQYQPHFKLVQKFVREWNILTETKKRLLINRGALFINPVAAYQQISSKQTSSTQRHKTKEDISLAAAKLASSINGSVRQISKKSRDEKETQDNYGVAQVIDSNGVPLCLTCEKPYTNSLLTTETISSTNNAWQTRFCSINCADAHWTKTQSGYCRDKIYQIEHGVCQLCQFDAHSCYKQIKETVDIKQRVKLISESKFSKLNSKVKEVMTRKPVEGQFWHVDHITPVWEGGGMCDIDNMRTLCVICHHKVTAQQATKRANVRRLAGAATNSADISAFFHKT